MKSEPLASRILESSSLVAVVQETTPSTESLTLALKALSPLQSTPISNTSITPVRSRNSWSDDTSPEALVQEAIHRPVDAVLKLGAK
jgi:hypothetical protein